MTVPSPYHTPMGPSKRYLARKQLMPAKNEPSGAEAIQYGTRCIRSGTNSGCVKYKTLLVLAMFYAALVVTQTRILLSSSWLLSTKAVRSWVPASGEEDPCTCVLQNRSAQSGLKIYTQYIDSLSTLGLTFRLYTIEYCFCILSPNVYPRILR